MAPGRPDRTAGDADARRYQLFDQTSEALDRIATQWPLLIVLDDLHWADTPTLQLLRHLSRRPNSSSVLIVGAYRDAEVERAQTHASLFADLIRDARARLSLRGLTEAEVAQLVEQRVGTDLRGSPASFVEQMRVATSGNPFFIDQVLRHLHETGASVVSWRQVGVPDEVRSVISQRA